MKVNRIRTFFTLSSVARRRYFLCSSLTFGKYYYTTEQLSQHYNQDTQNGTKSQTETSPEVLIENNSNELSTLKLANYDELSEKVFELDNRVKLLEQQLAQLTEENTKQTNKQFLKLFKQLKILNLKDKVPDDKIKSEKDDEQNVLLKLKPDTLYKNIIKGLDVLRLDKIKFPSKADYDRTIKESLHNIKMWYGQLTNIQIGEFSSKTINIATSAARKVALEEVVERYIVLKLSHPPKTEVPNIPRHPIVLCHGMGGDKPMLKYFRGIKEDLESLGCKVYQPVVPRYAGVLERSSLLRDQMLEIQKETGHQKFNFIAHSMGGLDARYLISNLEGWKMASSLTTVSTPHRGSAWADYWILQNNIVFNLPKFHKFLPFEMLAPFNLTSKYLTEEFNPNTLDHPDVKYFSFGGKLTRNQNNMILWVPHGIVHKVEGDNDGLVSIDSSKWGEYIETLEIDHASMINWGKTYDARELYRKIANILYERGF